MLLACIVAGRCCRCQGIDARRLLPVLLPGAAASETSGYSICMNWCWQELRRLRHRRMPFTSSFAGKSCRRRLQHMPLVGIVAGRSFRWQGVRACRRQTLLRAGAARGTASAHAVCTHCCWQEKPPLARHHRMTCAFIVASRCCRRRGTSACRVQALSLAGAAAFQASTHAGCIQCCWQERPPAGPQRMPLAHRRIPFASIAAGRFCHRRGLIACCLHASFSPTSMSLTRLGAAPALTNGVGGRGLRHRQVLDVNKCQLHRRREVPAGLRGGPSGIACLARVCSPSTLRSPSWSARKAFSYRVP